MFRVLVIAAALSTSPALAQDESDQLSEGMNLLRDGTQMLLEGLMSEFGPAMKDLEGRIDDLNAYEPPEILPNGDIIIRRKQPVDTVDPDEDGEIEL